jgi:hypothetical protein
MESQECSSANYRILEVQSTLGLALHIYCMAFRACQLAACKVSIGTPDSRPLPIEPMGYHHEIISLFSRREPCREAWVPERTGTDNKIDFDSEHLKLRPPFKKFKIKILKNIKNL